MANASDIRPHMEVYGSDGTLIGTVDHVDGDSIKLARKDQVDGQHHYVPLSAVARVDTHVHLNSTAALLTTRPGYGTTGTTTHVAAEPARSKSWLPWLLLALALLVALLLFRSCSHKEPTVDTTVTTATTTGGVATANGAATVNTTSVSDPVPLPADVAAALKQGTITYDVQHYLAGSEAAPRTFAFDKLNFDTASAAIRPEDQPTVDTLAQILAAYPSAKIKIVGYADARGSAPANATLGQQRADAVAAALVAKGVAKDRGATGAGGESNPADTNATAPGQAENRRTELVVVSR